MQLRMRAPMVCVGVVVVAGWLGPVLVTASPTFQTPDSLMPPSPQHLLGTDHLGRDLLSRVVSGIRVDLAVALIAAPIGAILGTAIGLLATVRSPIDTTVQRLFDVLFAFPGFILGVSLAAILRPGAVAIGITIILLSAPRFGRQIRNLVVQLRTREFVLASELIGASKSRILFRRILPNAIDVLIVQLALTMSVAVFVEGGLSFLGVGIQAPQPSLGSLLNQSLPYLSTVPTYAVAPMVPITLLVVGFSLISDGLNRGLLRH